MKLLTAVIAPNHLQRVTAALDGAGFTATTVTSAQASGLEGRSLGYHSVKYRDQRCVRLEILVGDSDLQGAVALLATSCGQADGNLIAWASDVLDMAARPADTRVLVTQG